MLCDPGCGILFVKPIKLNEYVNKRLIKKILYIEKTNYFYGKNKGIKRVIILFPIKQFAASFIE